MFSQKLFPLNTDDMDSMTSFSTAAGKYNTEAEQEHRQLDRGPMCNTNHLCTSDSSMSRIVNSYESHA